MAIVVAYFPSSLPISTCKQLLMVVVGGVVVVVVVVVWIV
jgi:hypothetical protein